MLRRLWQRSNASARHDREDGSSPLGVRVPKAWRSWLGFVIVNVLLAGYYGYAFVTPVSSVRTSLLPGKTTHGHYQIEMACNQCHASADAEIASSGDVLQDACVRCHGEALDEIGDTHPAKKFNDPTNAALLSVLDAQKCITCHREHVPEQTSAMGLTVPTDYCWHCHQDVAESRPSHEGMAFDSCATAGCHNYHDNRALYEKFLDNHFGEPDVFEDATLPSRTRTSAHEMLARELPVDAPKNWGATLSESHRAAIVSDWRETVHAAAGVGCQDCHRVESGMVRATDAVWSDAVALETCSGCHASQADTFLAGKHGMRLAAGLSPMTPEMARLRMRSLDSIGSKASDSGSMTHLDAHPGDPAHRQLTCNACHAGHRFDTSHAAVDACLNCHADEHSLAYRDSAHAELWVRSRRGSVAESTGVSCASCHMPRLEDRSGVTVSHNQSGFLRPSDTMAREVCGHCHGLEFSLSSLADPDCVGGCFSVSPATRNESVRMAHEHFESRRKRRSRPSP